MPTVLRLLLHNHWRFVWAVAGIAVAIIIVFLEQGIFYSILDSQARIATLVRGDLVVLHPARTNLDKWNTFERVQLFRINAVEGVAKVIPIYKRDMGLLDEKEDRVRRIIVYAFPADELPLDIGAPERIGYQLKQKEVVLFDQKSRDIFGQISLNDYLELNERLFRLVGYVGIGPSIVNDGAVVMSEGTWLKVRPEAQPILGVIRVSDPMELETVKQRLIKRYPELTFMTPTELAERERYFTATAAPIGILFGIGMAAGLVVGVVICYQILFNEIMDQLSQYATLKAIGFTNRFLTWLILQQALVLCVLGFMMATPLVWAMFRAIAERTGMVMNLEPERVLIVFILTLAMSIGAGLLALRTVLKADPADLY